MSNNETDLQKFLHVVNEEDYFGNYIGIEVTDAHDGYARAKMVLDQRHFNPIGSVHGGCVFSLADTVAGAATFSTGASCTTLSAHTVFLRAAMLHKSHVLYADAIPLRNGRKIVVYKVVVTDDLKQEIAEFTIEFYKMGDIPKSLEEKLK
ncbi:MAG: PaaI family thioesterase [Clostridiales bacterium]|nr:PaaI family thioesterase [Clostridiales bacterium]MDY3745976.1 PaaI family thioesterase [Lachnospiraceae bacterium]